ncbi:MAG: (d)CMP kinase [Anaerolineae bacterium]|nr:(d)CMP kinase [Anaerolineae bacterium]
MQRILVIGTSGSGKTTLARQLSDRLGIPFIPTDPLYWGKNWAVIPRAIVRQRVAEVVSQPAWVMDGNFDNERELVWDNADHIVWLDYPLALTLWRVAARNLGWWISQTPVWSGNRMTLARLISGVRHSIRSYPIKQANYREWLAAYPAGKVVIFRCPAEVTSWLAKLPRSA